MIHNEDLNFHDEILFTQMKDNLLLQVKFSVPAHVLPSSNWLKL